MGALTLDLAREALNHRMDRHLCRSLEPRTLDVRSVLESVLRLPKTRFRVQGLRQDCDGGDRKQAAVV